MSGFAELIEAQARGSRDFHRFLHHRLRQPLAVIEDPRGLPTVSPDLLGEAVVHVAVLRALLRQAEGPECPASPAEDPAGWSLAEHCGAVASALEGAGKGRRRLRRGDPSDTDIAGRINRAATGQPAPRYRYAREVMAWHKRLAVQWFSGSLDQGCDLCAVGAAAGGWLVSDLPGEWR